MKIRYLSTPNCINNGCVLQAVALQEHIAGRYPSVDVRTFSYTVPKTQLYDYLKVARPFPGDPLFYLKRHRLFREFVREHLVLDDDVPSFLPYEMVTTALNQTKCDMVMTGCDVWALNGEFHRPRFPNPYWLAENVRARKVAFGMSAYNSDASLFQRNATKLRSILSGFEFVGARELETYRLVEPYVPEGKLHHTYDAAFWYQYRPTALTDKLERLGIDTEKPILSVIYPNTHPVIRAFISAMRGRGYQSVGLSMYNRDVDVNLGAVLNPFEWAEMFTLSSFSVTTLFHGTIFSLMAGVPFLAIDTGVTPEHSKKYQMLADFSVPELRVDLPGVSSGATLIEKHDDVARRWSADFAPRIAGAVSNAMSRNTEMLGGIICAS